MQRICKRHPFDRPLGRYCIAYAQACEFKAERISDSFLSLIRLYASGFNQSRINEQANQVVKDHQTRDSRKKARVTNSLP